VSNIFSLIFAHRGRIRRQALKMQGERMSLFYWDTQIVACDRTKVECAVYALMPLVLPEVVYTAWPTLNSLRILQCTVRKRIVSSTSAQCAQRKCKDWRLFASPSRREVVQSNNINKLLLNEQLEKVIVERLMNNRLTIVKVNLLLESLRSFSKRLMPVSVNID